MNDREPDSDKAVTPASGEPVIQASDEAVTQASGEALRAELEEPDQLELAPVEAQLTPLRRFDPTVLANPTVVRALIGMAAAGAIIIWPDRTDRILARLVGVALIAFSLNGARAALSRLGRADRATEPRRWRAASLSMGFAAIGLLIGVYLLAAPAGSASALARLVGLMILGLGVRELLSANARSGVERKWVAMKGIALIIAGAVVLAYPGETFATLTVIFAIGWLAVGAVAVMASVDPDHEGVAGYGDAGSLISDWLVNRPKDADDRRSLYDKILYEGPLLRRRVIRFVTLMSFASVIASMGVITDSTAVVIGAMLIAPLMTPLMGMAISLVMGWPTRLTRSALIAAGGIALAISIGIFLGLVAPTVIDTTTNGQILARSSPTVLDLIIALAAGAAGAYGLSRPDVSDSLPGVAIAISLVPPLTVVGIAYSQGDWGAGNGALLLFATNMLAILVMGGVTFILTGVTPVSRVAENQHRVKTSAATVAVFAGAVLGALLLNGSQIAETALQTGTVEEVVDDWLAEYPDHEVVRSAVVGDIASVVIIGPTDDRPPAAELAELLKAALDRPITAEVRLLVEERDVATAE